MINEFNDLSENKLRKVLEYFLSLHEADEIFDNIFDDDITIEDILYSLEFFRQTET